MATEYGVTPEGFVRKRLDVILSEISQDIKSALGDDIDLSADTPDGQILGNLSDRLSDVWQLGELIYLAFDPNAAQGISLKNIALLNGVRAKEKTATTAEAVFYGDPGTVIPKDEMQIAPGYDASLVFKTTESKVIPGGGSIQIKVECQIKGAIIIAENTLTQILTPISGVTSVTNPIAGSTGQEGETPEQLRQRRNESTSKNSANMIDSLYGKLNQVLNVTEVKVYDNDQDTTDGKGLPPHSIACIVEGGDEVDIANTIWTSKTGGATLVGDVTKTIYDDQGFPHIVKFARPAPVSVYINLTIKRLPGYVETGAAEIKDAILSYAKNNFKIGKNVIYSRLYTPINSVPNHEITSMTIGATASPVGTGDIAVDYNKKAAFNKDNIIITVTD